MRREQKRRVVLYIITHGQCHIEPELISLMLWSSTLSSGRSLSEKRCGEFGPGDALGANSLVGEGMRAARAETLSRARVLHLGRDAFQRFIDAQPRAACRLLEALLREQAHTTREALELVGAALVDRPAAAD